MQLCDSRSAQSFIKISLNHCYIIVLRDEFIYNNNLLTNNHVG